MTVEKGHVVVEHQLERKKTTSNFDRFLSLPTASLLPSLNMARASYPSLSRPYTPFELRLTLLFFFSLSPLSARTSSAAAVPGTPSRRTSSRVSLPPAPPTPRSSKPTPTKPKPTPSKKAKISAPIPEDQEMKDAPAAVDGLKRKRSSVGRPRGSVASSMGGGGLQRKKVFKAGLNVVPMPPCESDLD